jgi:hypothetical protein
VITIAGIIVGKPGIAVEYTTAIVDTIAGTAAVGIAAAVGIVVAVGIVAAGIATVRGITAVEVILVASRQGAVATGLAECKAVRITTVR